MADGKRDFRDPTKIYTEDSVGRFVENVVLSFYQELFSRLPAQQTPSAFHYDDVDENATEVKIEGRATDNLKTVDTRPKIIVGRGSFQWQSRGIGGGIFIGGRDLSLEKQRHSDINTGSVNISAFERDVLERVPLG